MSDPTGTPSASLSATRAVIEQGIAAGLHIGAQVYVSIKGEPVADLAIGQSRPGVAMTPDTLMLWLSGSKPIGAVAIAQLWERGKLGLDDPVTRHIPEFGQNGKGPVTLRHILTHTAGFRWIDTGWPAEPWDQVIARICQARQERNWIAGRKAGYSPVTSWFILGEIVRRLDGRDYDRYVREEILTPLGMDDCWLALPPDRYRAYGDRIGIMQKTDNEGGPADSGLDSEQSAAACSPAGGGRGPARQLVRFYEMLLRGGTPLAARCSPHAVRTTIEASSGDRKAASGDREAAPGGRQAAPGGRQAAPGDREAAPGDREAAPGDREAAPGDREAAPGDREAAPGGREAAPGDREAAPGDREAAPGDREAAPGDREAAPGDREAAPGGREAAPGGREAASGHSDPLPSPPHHSAPQDTPRLLLPQTIEALVARHRAGMKDHTFNHVMDWGLGFLVNSALYGPDTVPYGYGPHASPRTYGHGGSQSSASFADPEHGLAVAVICNGMPGEPAHQTRIRAILAAIYDDIGLGREASQVCFSTRR